MSNYYLNTSNKQVFLEGLSAYKSSYLTVDSYLQPTDSINCPTIAAPKHTVVNKSITSFPYLNGIRLANLISSTEQFSITLVIGADQ